MNLPILVRNTSFFQNTKNINYIVTSDLLDNEFNKIARYINNKLNPVLDKLLTNNLLGIIGNIGFLLRNVGDKSTIFDRIKINDIKDNTISLSNLKRLPSLSLVLNNKNFDFISYENRNTTLINNGNKSIFGKISENNIIDNSISSIKIKSESLTKYHLANELFNYRFEGILLMSKILNEELNSFNISERSYSDNKISDSLYKLRDNNISPFKFKRQDVTNIVDDLCIIKRRHIKNNSINFNHMFGNNRVLNNNIIPLNSVIIPQNKNLNFYNIFKNGFILYPEYIKDFSFYPIIQNNVNPKISKSKLSNNILQRLIVGGLQ